MALLFGFWLVQFILILGITNAWDRNLWFGKQNRHFYSTRPSQGPASIGLAAFAALLPIVGPLIPMLIFGSGNNAHFGFSLNFSNKR